MLLITVLRTVISVNIRCLRHLILGNGIGAGGPIPYGFMVNLRGFAPKVLLLFAAAQQIVLLYPKGF